MWMLMLMLMMLDTFPFSPCSHFLTRTTTTNLSSPLLSDPLLRVKEKEGE